MSTESIKAAFREPFAWHWTDSTGCLFITGDERKPDIPADAKPLYAVAPSAISSLISSYEATERRVAELEEALKPFVTDWADQDGWSMTACQKDRIFDWFGPSDFRAAAAALTPTVEKVETPAQGTPSPQAHMRVKPLVWHDVRGDGSVTATTTIGLQYFASGTAWGFRNYPDLYPVEGGIEVAKSEAQADYEARILPLIDTTEGQP